MVVAVCAETVARPARLHQVPLGVPELIGPEAVPPNSRFPNSHFQSFEAQAEVVLGPVALPLVERTRFAPDFDLVEAVAGSAR